MEKRSVKSSLIKIIRFIIDNSPISWFEWIEAIWKFVPLLKDRFTRSGIYEVLEYETTLELHDPKGKKATVNKRQKVRYLQDHIIAYQDQAWGDGEILMDYKCSPGVPVDRYQFGHKTIILISLRKEKNKGSTDEFNIQWRMDSGFMKDVESWATVIQHKTKHLKVEIIFPANRPPTQVTLLDSKRRKTSNLGDNIKTQLPDGRWQVSWEKFKPKLYAEYILEWQW